MSNDLLWQAKFEEVKKGEMCWVTDGCGGRCPRPNFVLKPGISNKIKFLAYSPDGTRLAMADTAGVVLFDSENGRLVWLHETIPGVEKITFSEDGKTITAKGPKSEEVFDAASGRPVKRSASK